MLPKHGLGTVSHFDKAWGQYLQFGSLNAFGVWMPMRWEDHWVHHLGKRLRIFVMASFPNAFDRGQYEKEVKQKKPEWKEVSHRQPIHQTIDSERNRCMTSRLPLGGRAYTPFVAMVMRIVSPLVVLMGCTDEPSLQCTMRDENRCFHQYQTKEIKLAIQSGNFGCLACKV